MQRNKALTIQEIIKLAAPRRIALQREVNRNNIPPFSFERFRKTPTEKKQLKNAKHAYKRYCFINGIQPI